MHTFTTRALPSCSTTARLLGLAFGGVLLLTGVVAAPADAATIPSKTPGTAADIAPRPTLVIPKPQPTLPPAPAPTFHPDVRVSYVGASSNGGTVVYRYRVANVGIGGAYNVALEKTVEQRTFNGEAATHQTFTGQVASLETDQSTEVTVTCQPLGGHFCHSAALKATVGNDLDPANNLASSD